MKKLIYLSAVLAILSSSCKNMLEETSKDKITSESVFSTPEGLSTAVIALYNLDRNIYRNDAESTVWTSFIRAEDITVTRAGSGVGFARYDNTVNASTSQVGLFWSHYYTIIERANKIISSGEAVGLGNAEVAQAVAEARCFRARSYFYLLRTFDRIILNTEATSVDNLERTYAPAEPEDVYKLMYSDLDYAIGKLSYTAKNPGRFTQGVARHVKAEVALWRKDYKEAALQADEIITKGPYKLLADPADIFKGANLNHSEAIFVSQWDRASGGSAGNPVGHRLAQYFVPNYFKQAGILVTDANGGSAWGRTYPNPYLIGLYPANDKRLAAFYKLFWVYDDPATLPAGKKLGDKVTSTNASIYFDQLYPACFKYVDLWTKLAPNEAQSFKDIIIYRLAETYLIGAEAHMREGGANDPLAVKYMSAIRERAGLGVFTGAVTENLIIDEDARELSFEGQRWYLLKRLGKLVERVKLYAGDPAVSAIQARTGIQDYHVRWPIPQSEIDNMKGKGTFTQNPGYPQ
ncbi:RagB/SusD family nutrient uptake outer membrane protein [Hufsiella ginkgonis]|uniref:RagB/SusD family nutrient uptake outer membrane protein n=1 Tax=Hufsiella ginkgonis TaxID=2695274 RepID=A0A7K1XXP5_9SPHI|nr:RagB/SusD family nutrient uptake outer membrane protein [Hufsiella ginkgonis]MXV15781.1 RagB/SusD family nutrient uptake outer membrane protein [Hufsiella ginkgonis]